MKLKIKNYNKIIGKELHITKEPQTVWVISDVSEREDFYVFFCKSPGGRVRTIRLYREPGKHGLQSTTPIFYFEGSGNEAVSADWFADMDNAVSVLTSRLEDAVIDDMN